MKSVASPIEERLLARRRVTASGCWEWSLFVQRNGYATTGTGKRGQREYVHRLAYELWKGAIPEGFDIDHLCRNRRCYNPAHLDAVTRAVNMKRGIGPAMLGKINGSKTHCVNGHAFDEANTRHRPTGGRDCRICGVEKARRYRENRHASK